MINATTERYSRKWHSIKPHFYHLSQSFSLGRKSGVKVAFCISSYRTNSWSTGRANNQLTFLRLKVLKNLFFCIEQSKQKRALITIINRNNNITIHNITVWRVGTVIIISNSWIFEKTNFGSTFGSGSYF